MTACLGVLLEACQLAIRSRFTSTTDVLVFTLGAWIGALAYNWFNSPASSMATEQTKVARRRRLL